MARCAWQVLVIVVARGTNRRRAELGNTVCADSRRHSEPHRPVRLAR